MVRKYLLLSVFALAGLTSGCASVTGSTTQNVSVQAREHVGADVKGAVCELSNSKGKWFVTTPGSVMIHRSNDDMQVLCSKEGYESGRSSVVSVTKGEMFGNIILGGVIGAVIDHNNGSGYEYPEFIQVLMRAFSRSDSPMSANQPAPQGAAALSAVALSAVSSTPNQAAVQREPLRQERSRFEPEKSAPRRDGSPSPQVGDSWTYRYRDGFGKTGTYTVQVKAASADEITDELKMGRVRDASTFSPGLALTDRKAGEFTLREISPYLLSLGPAEPTFEWRRVQILAGNQPFTAQLAGFETVQVQAGTFEARKVVIKGQQVLSGSYFYGNPSRTYTVTAWYAPAAKRFVKLVFSAQGGGQFTHEDESIELVETNFDMRVASAQPVPDERPLIEKSAPRRDSGSNPQAGDSWTYRFSDNFGKSGTYTVQVKAVSADEISDELQIGRARETSTFSPGLALTDRKAGEFTLREISPYLMSLGPAEPTAEWKNVNILAGNQPFTARLAGFETVQVQAGTFETRKVVIEGRQVSASYFASLSTRAYSVTVWYAPAAKRFVKLVFSGQGGGQFSSEKETIELVDTNFEMRLASAQTSAGQ